MFAEMNFSSITPNIHISSMYLFHKRVKIWKILISCKQICLYPFLLVSKVNEPWFKHTPHIFPWCMYSIANALPSVEATIALKLVFFKCTSRNLDNPAKSFKNGKKTFLKRKIEHFHGSCQSGEKMCALCRCRQKKDADEPCGIFRSHLKPGALSKV